MDILQRTFDSAHKCAHCSNSAITHTCGWCFTTSYCNDPVCYQTHWKTHESECKQIQSLLFIDGKRGRDDDNDEFDNENDPNERNTKNVKPLISLRDLPSDVYTVLMRYLSAGDSRNLSLTERNTRRAIKTTMIRNWRWKVYKKSFFREAWTHEIQAVMLYDNIWGKAPNIIDVVFNVNKLFESSRFPNMRKLRFGPQYIRQTVLPNLPNLTHLTFGNNYNQPVDLSNAPNLTHLTFAQYYDLQTDLSGLGKLADLSFGFAYNQETDLSGLTSLTDLTFGGFYNQQTDLSGLTNLTRLEFGIHYDQKTDLSGLDSLTHLRFGIHYNQQTDLSGLDSLTHLEFRLDYNQPTDLRGLTNLTHLTFGYRYDRVPKLSTLSNLTFLHFNGYYVQGTDFSTLFNLTRLILKLDSEQRADKTILNGMGLYNLPKLNYVDNGYTLYKTREEVLEYIHSMGQ